MYVLVYTLFQIILNIFPVRLRQNGRSAGSASAWHAFVVEPPPTDLMRCSPLSHCRCDRSVFWHVKCPLACLVLFDSPHPLNIIMKTRVLKLITRRSPPRKVRKRLIVVSVLSLSLKSFPPYKGSHFYQN